MYQIKIVENPFNYTEAAWEDEWGRVGVRVEGENSVRWYNCFTESGRCAILEEVEMIVDQPFNTNPKVLMEI
jgi:hypothetical protein